MSLYDGSDRNERHLRPTRPVCEYREADQQAPASVAYSYDLAGNRLSREHQDYTTSNSTITAYTYNDRDQLLIEDRESDNGVAVTRHMTRHFYDGDGSLIREETSADGATWTPSKTDRWDSRGRMTGLDANGDGDFTDPGDTTFDYDKSNVLVGKRVVKGPGSGGGGGDGGGGDGGSGGSTVSHTAYLIDPQNQTGYAKAIEERQSTGAPPSPAATPGV